MENLLQRLDSTVLFPALAVKIPLLVAACRARGVDYWAISGERTWAEQTALYQQGRDAKGNVIGTVVTKAKAGSSAHNYAVAVDFCRDKDATRAGLQPDWKIDDYQVLAEEAEKLGLESGLNWNFVDAPHIQLPLMSKGILLIPNIKFPHFPDLRSVYQKGGKSAVFAFLNKYNW